MKYLYFPFMVFFLACKKDKVEPQPVQPTTPSPTTFQLLNSTNSPLPDNSVNNLCVDDAGSIWIATNAGLARYNTGTWTIYDSATYSFASNVFNTVKSDHLGN